MRKFKIDVQITQAEIKATKSLKKLEALLRNKLNSLRERTDMSAPGISRISSQLKKDD